MEELLMARFDVFANPGAGAKAFPYLVELQSNLLDGLDTTVVAPLKPAASYSGTRLPERLMPTMRVKGRDYVVDMPRLAAIPRGVFKAPVANLAPEQATLVAALDFLFQGY
jgi:toxin CcdB